MRVILDKVKMICATSEARAFIVAILLCFADTLITAWLALESNSLTVFSAFFGAGIDLLAVTAAYVTFVFVRIRRQSQTRFAFGIGKLENIISMVIAALMLLGAQQIIFDSIDSIREPKLVDAALTAVILFFVYAIISSVMCFHYRSILKTKETPIICSQYALWY